MAGRDWHIESVGTLTYLVVLGRFWLYKFLRHDRIFSFSVEEEQTTQVVKPSIFRLLNRPDLVGIDQLLSLSPLVGGYFGILLN